jgi:hypothetical protein
VIDAVNHPINCGTATTAEFARTFRKRSVIETGYDLLVSEAIRQTAPETVGQNSIQDREVNVVNFESAETDFQVQVIASPTFTGTDVSVEALGGKVSLVDGTATFVEPGKFFFSAISTDGEKVLVPAEARQLGGGQVNFFERFLQGTACLAASESIDSLLTGEASGELFSVLNDQDSVYVRNENCWAAPIDNSCVSVWNSIGGRARAGTLISPRHIVFAGHFPISPVPLVGNNNINQGEVITFQNPPALRFVSPNNEVVTRTLTSVYSFGLSSLVANDVVVGLLDSDVPESISFAKVLPANYAQSMPGFSSYDVANPLSNPPDQGWIPSLHVNRNKRANIFDVRIVFIESSFSIFNRNKNPLESPVGSPLRGLFFQPVSGGDSGSPQFLAFGNELALLHVFRTPANGAQLNKHIPEINAVMDLLGGGYQLTPIDLSAFPTY